MRFISGSMGLGDYFSLCGESKGDPLRDIICVTKYEMCGQTRGDGVMKH